MANYGKYGFLPSIALCLLWATEVSWAQVKLVRMPVVEKSGSISSGKSIIRLWRINKTPRRSKHPHKCKANRATVARGERWGVIDEQDHRATLTVSHV